MILQSIIGMAAVLISAFLSYLFHFYMVRSLPINIYGELSLVIGILTIVLVPTGSLQTIFTREVAKLDRQENKILQFLKGYAKTISIYGIAAGIIFFMSSFAIGFIFNDSNIVTPLQIVAVSIPAVFLLSIMKGYFQGKEKIGILSVLMILEPAIKLGSGFLLVYAGFGLFGASASLAIAPVILLVMMIPIFLKHKSKISGNIKHKLNSSKPFLFIMATNILLMIFLYIDLFFVKYYLGSEEAGFYNVANITAKMLMFAMGGIILVFLPKTSKLNMQAHTFQIKKLVAKAVMLMLPIFIVFMIFPEQIITIFYTSKYLSALMPFKILAGGMFAYAIFTLLLNLFWSQNREKTMFLLSLIILPVDILLLFCLMPAYGLTGAAIATSLSSIIILTVSAILLKNGFKIIKY